MSEHMELDAVLDEFLGAVRERDAALARAVVAADASIVGSATGEEMWGREQTELFLAHVCSGERGFDFRLPRRVWRVVGDVAWAWCDGTMLEPRGEAPKPYRLTVVLVHEDGAWRLALWSGAEPA